MIYVLLIVILRLPIYTCRHIAAPMHAYLKCNKQDLIDYLILHAKKSCLTQN